MAVIRTRVDPPAVRAPLYGLLDTAIVIDDDDDSRNRGWHAGIEYDTFSCHQAKVWGDWCTGAGTPTVTPITRLLSLTMTGSVAGTGDDARYSLAMQASIDAGAQRQIRFDAKRIGGDPVVVNTTTGSPAVAVFDDVDTPVSARIIITDILTGTQGITQVQQNVDGTLAAPVGPVVVALREPGVPDDCDTITTTVTATDATGGLAQVTVDATTTAAAARDLVVWIGSTRVALSTADAAVTVMEGAAPGTYRISVRDVASWSLMSGWIHVGDDLSATATLVQATCPTKDIVTPPWRSLAMDPFVVFSDVACSTMGFNDAAKVAVDALSLAAGPAVERHYWESLIARGHNLDGQAAVDVRRGVAQLEQYLAASYNGAGILHTSAWGVAYLADAGVLDATATGDERLRTWRGTPIVVGNGYAREGSNDPATGDDFWMFATGDITVMRSPIAPVETVDYPSNTRMAVAEQIVAILDDCLDPASVRITPAGTT